MIQRKTEFVDVLNIVILIIICAVTLYPFIYTVSVSISSDAAVARAEITLLPKGINFRAYYFVVKDKFIMRGYKNSVLYTVVGTVLRVIITFMIGYPLSKKNLPHRGLITFFIVFTMFFSGGLIPTFLVVTRLKMYNTMWALIFPTLVFTWNMLLVRNYIMSAIPIELEEAAFIDGANEMQILIRVIIPLSIPILAVIALFYTISMWNDYFQAMIYLRDDKLFPITLVIRRVLIEGSQIGMEPTYSDPEKQRLGDNIRYAVVVATIMPLLIAYPFVQKHFVKGVVLGSLKG